MSIARAKEEQRCLGCGGIYWQNVTKAYRGKFCSIECRQLGALIKCERCGEYKRSYNPGSALCSDCAPYKYELYEPVERKAWSLGANIIGGRGKKAWVMELITTALEQPCVYCGSQLTLKNIQLDHKEPYGSTSARRDKAINKELRAHVDRRENLQIICRTCNQFKGDMNDQEFRSLLTWLNDKPELATKIKRRIMQGITMWKR